MALFLVASVFIAGGLTYKSEKKSVVLNDTMKEKIQVPLTFSQTTGFEEVKIKPLRLYLSER